MNNKQEILTCKIDTANPIEVEVLSDSLKAISLLYKEVVKNNEAKIEISEVRKGSFEFDFIVNYGAMLPFIADIGISINLIEFFKNLRLFFSKKTDENIENSQIPTKNQAENFGQAIQIINNGGTVNIYSNQNTDNSFIMDASEAKLLNKNIKHYIANYDKVEEKTINQSKNFKSYWIKFTQTRSDDKKGYKIRCASIYDDELNASFDDKILQNQIMKSENNPYNFQYLADLEVEYFDNKKPTCRILSINDKKLLEPQNLVFNDEYFKGDK